MTHKNNNTQIVLLRKIYLWLPVFIWMGVIFFLSAQPVLKANQSFLLDFLIKKGAHAFEYALLFILLSRARNYQHHMTTFLFTLLYAFIDETHQLFTPGRTGTIRDVLFFDLLGIILAWLYVPTRK